MASGVSRDWKGYWQRHEASRFLIHLGRGILTRFASKLHPNLTIGLIWPYLDQVRHTDWRSWLNTVGSRIRALRMIKGYKASDLARLTSVSATAVANWEKNGSIPRPAVLERVANALGTTTEYLLTGTAAPTSGRRTVDDIVREAAAEIARVTGASPDRVRLTLEIKS